MSTILGNEGVDQELEEELDEKDLLRRVNKELKELRKIATAQLDQQKPQAPKLARSKMTNKDKAAYIGEHGSAAYFQIPWD